MHTFAYSTKQILFYYSTDRRKKDSRTYLEIRFNYDTVTVRRYVNQCHLLKLEKLTIGLNTSGSGFSEDIFTLQAIRKTS